MIRWKKGDYISLGRAVADFNRKIEKLEKTKKRLYLPEKVNYENLKENILTRKELNRVINSLKDFKQKGAEKLVTTEGGETLTKWELENLGKQIKIAERQLKKEAKEFEKPYSSGYSKAQMGFQEYRQLLSNIRSIQNLEKKSGIDIKTIKARIKKLGTYDYEMMKATIYRENFMKAFEESGYKNFENYKVLKEKFNRIKNPINFFKFIQNSDVFSDIFLYYKEGYGVVYNFGSDEERFNYGLEELGLI